MAESRSSLLSISFVVIFSTLMLDSVDDADTTWSTSALDLDMDISVTDIPLTEAFCDPLTSSMPGTPKEDTSDDVSCACGLISFGDARSTLLGLDCCEKPLVFGDTSSGIS